MKKELAENFSNEKPKADFYDICEKRATAEKPEEFLTDNIKMFPGLAKENEIMEIKEEERSNTKIESGAKVQTDEIKHEDWFAKRFIYIYAVIVTLFTFTYIFLITFVPIHEKNVRIVDTVLGFLLGVSLSTIIQFFFGSSKGSSDKQSQIALMMQKLNQPTHQPTSEHKDDEQDSQKPADRKS